MEDLNIQELLSNLTKGSTETLTFGSAVPTADSLKDQVCLRIEALLKTTEVSPNVAAEIQSLSSLLDTLVHNKEGM